MVLLRQAGLVLAVLFLGELISRGTGIPVPGNVMGMMLMLAALITGLIKLEMISKVSDFLLKHLAFFFIPAGVGLINSLDLLGAQWMGILAVTLLSTVLVMGVTGLTVQWLVRRRSS